MDEGAIIEMEIVFTHQFENNIISITKTNDDESILVTTENSLYILKFIDCLYNIYHPNIYPNLFSSSSSVFLVDSIFCFYIISFIEYFVYIDSTCIYLQQIGTDSVDTYQTDNPIVDISISSTNDILVLTSMGKIMLIEHFSSFTTFSLLDDFSSFNEIHGCCICWCNSNTFISCYNCDGRLLVYSHSRSVFYFHSIYLFIG